MELTPHALRVVLYYFGFVIHEQTAFSCPHFTPKSVIASNTQRFEICGINKKETTFRL